MPPDTPNPASAAAPTGSKDAVCFGGAVREALLWLIREELYGDFDEIRIFGERGLRALEVENDLDMGRAFDQAVKHFRAVAANLKALILVRSGSPL
jgi:hypothetical protein